MQFVGSEGAGAVRATQATQGMQGRVFVGSGDAGAVRGAHRTLGVQGMQGMQAVEPTSSRLRLVDFIKIIRENGLDEATASDEDVEIAFSKHASMGTGK